MRKKTSCRWLGNMGKAWDELIGKNRKRGIDKTRPDTTAKQKTETMTNKENLMKTTTAQQDLLTLPSLIGQTELERIFPFFKAKADRHGMRIAFLNVFVGDCEKMKYMLDQKGCEDLLNEVCNKIINLSRKDEFIVKLDNNELYLFVPFFQSEEELCLLSERVLKGIEEAIRMEGRDFSISSRVGIAIYPKNGKTLDKLLSAANRAFYRVDGVGKRYHFTV